MHQLQTAGAQYFPVELFLLLPYLVHYVQFIGPGLALDVQRDTFIMQTEYRTRGLLVGQLYPGHVTQVDRYVVAVGNDDVFQVSRGLIFAHGTHDITPLAFVKVTAAVIPVFPFDSVGKLRQRYLAQCQLCRINDDVDLCFTAAVGVG